MISEPWRMWDSTELSGPHSLQPVPASTRPLSGQVTEAPRARSRGWALMASPRSAQLGVRWGEKAGASM